jgi:predicted nucleotidyltransferase
MSESTELLKYCKWPDLPAPYNQALQQAVQFILNYVEDVRCILVSGTIVRGNPSPSSDLDIYVIREKPQRQRLQRWFNGVPAEIFINPKKKVYEYFEEERKSARPCTAHMLHSGFTILALDDSLEELHRQAAVELQRTPDPSPQQLRFARYMAATQYEDATDIACTKPATSNMILGQAIHSMLRYFFLKSNQYLPRDKDLIEKLATLNPELAQWASAFYGSSSPEERLTLARDIADATIETQGFFEWASDPEDFDD